MQSAGCVKKRLAAQLHTLGIPVDGFVGGWAIVSLWRTVVVVTSVVRANCYCRQTMLTCMLTLYICRTRLYLEFEPRTLIGLFISSSFPESTVYGIAQWRSRMANHIPLLQNSCLCRRRSVRRNSSPTAPSCIGASKDHQDCRDAIDAFRCTSHVAAPPPCSAPTTLNTPEPVRQALPLLAF